MGERSVMKGKTALAMLIIQEGLLDDDKVWQEISITDANKPVQLEASEKDSNHSNHNYLNILKKKGKGKK